MSRLIIRTAPFPGLLAASLLAVAVAAPEARAAEAVMRLRAFAVNTSANVPSTRTSTVEIVIERWSTAEERDRMVTALKEGGPDDLLKALQRVKQPPGRLTTPGSIGFPLAFAWQIKNPEGGRRVIVATDRPVGFLEVRNSPRTMDYRFMLIDFRLNAKGKGQGKLIPLAKIKVNDEHFVEIESYASEPVRLTEVRELH